MKAALRIAAEEWRYWRRSRLAVAGTGLALLLLLAVAASTSLGVFEERRRRTAEQSESERRFLAQPARHPHRMVHYGHYVFRTPAPLALVDPGVDSVTGRAVFLEGHRQNTATFAESRASPGVGGIGHLTPSFAYRVLVPLLVILLGHGVVAREREERTLSTLLGQGLSSAALVMGKGLALLGAVVFLLAPLTLVAAGSLVLGESWVTAGSVALTYLLYLLLWGIAVLAASMGCSRSGSALALLLAVWLAFVVLLPRVGVLTAQRLAPVPGRLERDLAMRDDIAKAGDAHDKNDPVFLRVRDGLFLRYGVERVEDLPVNLRGVAAEEAEASLSRVLNRYADERMVQETQQARVVATVGWLSPAVALATASRALAGTDLATHHRFLRQAESLRLEFVQSLNRLHATQLSYADDVQRSRNPEAERRTRVSSKNWKLLREFRFAAAAPRDRLRRALPSLLALVLWTAALLGVVTLWARRMRS